jgi:hypothetical protein
MLRHLEVLRWRSMLYVEQMLVALALTGNALLLLPTRDATVAIGFDAETQLFVPVLLLVREE